MICPPGLTYSMNRAGTVGQPTGVVSLERILIRCCPGKLNLVDLTVQVDVVLRDGDDGGIVQPSLLKVCEEERTVLHDRPAKTQSVLCLGQRILSCCQRIACIEALIAKEAVETTAISIRTGLRNDVDGRRRRVQIARCRQT